MGGWYHVAARGVECRAIFEEVRDYEHFHYAVRVKKVENAIRTKDISS
jgi:hypothetical protein